MDIEITQMISNFLMWQFLEVLVILVPLLFFIKLIVKRK